MAGKLPTDFTYGSPSYYYYVRNWYDFSPERLTLSQAHNGQVIKVSDRVSGSELTANDSGANTTFSGEADALSSAFLEAGQIWKDSPQSGFDLGLLHMSPPFGTVFENGFVLFVTVKRLGYGFSPAGVKFNLTKDNHTIFGMRDFRHGAVFQRAASEDADDNLNAPIPIGAVKTVAMKATKRYPSSSWDYQQKIRFFDETGEISGQSPPSDSYLGMYASTEMSLIPGIGNRLLSVAIITQRSTADYRLMPESDVIAVCQGLTELYSPKDVLKISPKAPSGDPVQSYEITLRDGAAIIDKQQPQSAYTYSYTYIDNLTYKITITANGYEPYSENFTLPPGGLTLQPILTPDISYTS